jgi:gliding motility-associated-like protein
MNKRLLFILFSGYFNFLSAQENLVPNGRFEDTISCNDGNGGTLGAIKDWFVPLNKTLNVSDACQLIDWWRFIRDRKVGVDGSRSGFIETYYRGFADDALYSGRRYIAVKLREKLVENTEYYFEMMVRSVDTFPNDKLVNTVFTNGQDVAFTKDFPTFDFDIPRNFLDLRPVVRSGFHKDYEWRKVKGCFKAVGNEQYLVIGNFRNDAGTESISTGKTNKNFISGQNADYIIDNVVLVPMTVPIRDTAICSGETSAFDITKTIPDSVKYSWHTGATTPQYKTDKSEYINAVIEYTPTCFAVKTARVLVITPDYHPILRDTLICAGDTVTFTAGTGRKEETITWDNGNIIRAFNTGISGLYTAKIVNTCATWIDSFKLQTRDCGYGIYVPNVFSPDGDGVNDTFKPHLKADYLFLESYNFKIYNRWGNLIFQTKSIDEAWNGTVNNKTMSSEVYIWALEIKHQFNGKSEILTLSGDVTLIR